VLDGSIGKSLLCYVALRATISTPQGKRQYVRGLFATIADRYDLITRVLSYGQDRRWKTRAITLARLTPDDRVLDLACGTGDLCRELVRAGHRPIGADLSFGMLANARTTAPLVHADALNLPVPDGAVDGVTCGFALRNFTQLEPFFAELARVVRPGGRISLLEVAEPPNPVLRWGHGVYFGRVVPRIGGLLSDPAAYRYLPKSVAYLPEPAVMLDAIGAAGFDAVERRLLSVGISQIITATRTPAP